jgi:uncharacterized small protein (DUF1192 family)
MKKSLSEEATEVLESKLGKAEAKAFVRAVDEVISQITEIKWKTTKDELLSAIREEFINKNVFEERTSAIQQSINSSKSELITRIDGVNAGLTEKIEGVRAELIEKIEGVRAELIEKIEGVKTELNARIDGVNAKVDSIKAELDAKIEGAKAELSVKIDKVKSDIERQIQKTDMKLNFLIVLTIIAITLMNPVVAEIIKSLLKF